MRPRLYQLLKVSLCFFLLYCLQDWVVAGYRVLLQFVGSLTLSLVGVGLSCDEVCTIRIIAFFALVLTTTGRVVQRLLVLLVGLVVFVSIDLAGIYLGSLNSPLPPLVGETFFQQLCGFVWNLLGDLLLPVLLWIVAFERYPGVFWDGGAEEDAAVRQRSF